MLEFDFQIRYTEFMEKKLKICLICLIILLLGIIGIMKGVNMAKQETIPEIVKTFFDEEYKKEIYFYGNWNQYKVYYVSFPELDGGDSGLPTFLLYDGKTVRTNTENETFILMDIDN